MSDDNLDIPWDDLLFGQGDEEYETPTKTCKYCGKKNLVWGQLHGKWRLFDKKEVHSCKQG